jgi:hypothetical protein
VEIADFEHISLPASNLCYSKETKPADASNVILILLKVIAKYYPHQIFAEPVNVYRENNRKHV